KKAFDNKKNGGKHHVTFKSFRMEQKGGDSACSGMRNSVRSRGQTGRETCGMRNSVRSRRQAGGEACGMRNSLRGRRQAGCRAEEEGNCGGGGRRRTRRGACKTGQRISGRAGL